MDVRARPATVPLRPTRSEPALSKPSAFPVLVCDKAIPAGVARASILGRALPLPKANPRRIVVIGDTGCRIKTSDNVFQACDDSAQWPFAAVAAAAAAAAPDLVIHVGDYHYRENECPAGNAGCAGSPWGYGWDAWEADVFAPGENAACRRRRGSSFAAITNRAIARGRAGGASSIRVRWRRGRNCDVAADDAIGDYSEPYAVPLGSGRDADTQFIVFDSSLVGVAPLPAERSDARHGIARSSSARSRSPRGGRTRSSSTTIRFSRSRRTRPSRTRRSRATARCNRCSRRLQPTALFPPSVKALLSGHVHLFEVVSFSTPQPAQFVSGNGGDWIDTPLPQPLPAGRRACAGNGDVDARRDQPVRLHDDGARWRALADRRARCARHAAHRVHARRAAGELRPVPLP